MATQLKIVALALIGVIVLAEANALPPSQRVPRPNKEHKRAAHYDHGTSAAVGGSVAVGRGAAVAGFGVPADAGRGNPRAGFGSFGAAGGPKPVHGFHGQPNHHGGPGFVQSQLDEFLHGLSLTLQSYASDELVPELKNALFKFVEYVMDFLAKNKPKEMAAIQQFLQASADAAAKANAKAHDGGAGGVKSGGKAVDKRGILSGGRDPLTTTLTDAVIGAAVGADLGGKIAGAVGADLGGKVAGVVGADIGSKVASVVGADIGAKVGGGIGVAVAAAKNAAP